MNATIKAQWLEALRSGQYKQGREGLKFDDGSYCCLGVLCELAVKDGALAPAKREDNGSWHYRLNDAMPPNVVLEWTGGISDADLSLLAKLNDQEGYSFGEIADYIEEHLSAESLDNGNA